jgi:hypothetical protein
MPKKKTYKKTIYRVVYHILEPSYYDRSERNYTTKEFSSRKEALAFAEEAKKFHPAQIVVSRKTEETILSLSDTDDYKINRALNEKE